MGLGRSEKASGGVCLEHFLHVSWEDAEELEALAHLLGVGEHVVARQQILSRLRWTVGQEFLQPDVDAHVPEELPLGHGAKGQS